MAYHRQQGVDTAIVRIFNTYGPRMRAHDGRAIPTFLRQALQDRPITVFGDGSQTRSFCYVEDEIRGLIALAESGYHNPVNIGNPDEFTLLELAKTVIEVTGSRSEIVFEALPIDDPQVRQPDISLAREILGWEPEGEPARRARADDRAGRTEALVGRPLSAVASAGRILAGVAWTDVYPVTSLSRYRYICTGAHVDRRCVVTTEQREATNSQDKRGLQRSRPPVLPERDVRRKRPPFLSFVLRLETLRRVAPRRVAAGARLHRRGRARCSRR